MRCTSAETIYGAPLQLSLSEGGPTTADGGTERCPLGMGVSPEKHVDHMDNLGHGSHATRIKDRFLCVQKSRHASRFFFF